MRKYWNPESQINTKIALGSQKKTSEPVELELQIAVSRCVGPGNQTRGLYKSSRCS